MYFSIIRGYVDGPYFPKKPNPQHGLPALRKESMRSASGLGTDLGAESGRRGMFRRVVDFRVMKRSHFHGVSE